MKGFTIIELLIVIAIVGLIGGMVSIRFLQTDANTAVKNTALDLSSAIQEARSRTVSGQTSGTVSSWGVFVQVTGTPQAILFADTNGDEVYTAGDTVEEIVLDEATSIFDCKINGTSLTTCGVLFASPSGVASLFTSEVSPPSPLTKLRIRERSTTKTSVQANVDVSAPSGLVTSNVEL